MAKDPAPTAPKIINPTPKQRFMESGNRISAHRNVIGLEPLTASLDSALLHYQLLLAQGGTSDANAAAASMFKIRGALEFIDVFLKLAEPIPERPAPVNVTKLDHTA